MSHINIFNTLPDSPKVALFAREWKCKPDEALGLMVRWLCWLDKHTKDGRTQLTEKEVEQLIFSGKKRLSGFIKMGWAAKDKDGFIYSVDFDLYNGPTAKKRVQDAARQRKNREKQKNL